MEVAFIHIHNECRLFFRGACMYVLNNEFSANPSRINGMCERVLFSHEKCVCMLPFLLIEMQRTAILF